MTDGAVRMLVLMHAYAKGFSAMEVATMFTLYELCGAGTNLVAGVAGARFGVRTTLLSGLLLQLCGLGMLFAWDDGWSRGRATAFVTCAQALCGVAKDLTKLGGKTVTKLVTPDDKQSALFKLVSAITGLKNSFKGVGYFIGAAMLGVSYEAALWMQIGLIAIAVPFGVFGLDNSLGRVAKKNISLNTVFKQSYNMNMLSLSRMFLFGSRDLWFEVPLPFFLRSAEGMGWPRSAVGALLAGYIIVYGQLQAWTPKLFLGPLKQDPPNKYVAVLWNFALASVPLFLGGFIQSSIFQNHPGETVAKTVVIMIGVFVFAFIFAVNSAIHSYLVVKYADGNKVAINVGFYYMANAFGRLFGTIISGALYSYIGTSVQGFAACFWVSALFVIISTALEVLLDDNRGGLLCGSISCVDEPSVAPSSPV
jgi:MFS family permease